MAGISLLPGDFCREVQKLIPNATLDFIPDFRQQVASQWPQSIDDKESKADWGWEYNVDTAELAQKIYDGLADEYKALNKSI